MGDPVAIADEGVRKFKEEKFEVIIVDTSGRHRQEDALFEEMQQVSEAVNPNDVVFVMDSTIGQAMGAQATAFRRAVKVGSVIITKLDGHAKGGGALSAVAATESPIIFIGTGEHVKDFEQFDAKSFVQRLLGMGDIKGIMEMVKNTDLEAQAPALVERLTRGEFSLRDMRDQFANVLKMGPLDKMMSMLPGFAGDMIPKGKEKKGKQQVLKWDTGRMIRVARGSGHPIPAVHQLLEENKRMSKVMSKMKGMKIGKNGDINMGRNMPQQMSKMLAQINPNFAKMGGEAGMRQMMQQLQNGGMEGAFPGMNF